MQDVVHRDATCVVTLLSRAEFERPIVIAGRVVLEPEAPIIWFTFTRAHHDIGRFHLRDGSFTGYYANILTPVHALDDAEWHTTDLFLDVWLDPAGGARVLDEDELHAAEQAGWISPDLARGARQEAARIMAAIEAGEWPPSVARTWTLERVRTALEER